MHKTPANAFYGQSGGVTAVINTTACAVIQTAQKYPSRIKNIFAGKNGLHGLLQENLYDVSRESKKAISSLYYRPGGIFGSCRYKLNDLKTDIEVYQRIFDVLKAHHIRYFFYNGGNDSADTTYKISKASRYFNYPLTCIAIPKTIDNDLPITDNCPGFASVAKFIATVSQEIDQDISSMQSATQIYILEVMGRNSGWIAAASGLAKSAPEEGPHIILFPEILFNESKFLKKVQTCVKNFGYCFIVTSESLRDLHGEYLSSTGQYDVFGHLQMAGVARLLADRIKEKFGFQYHYSIAGYIERAARHLGAKIDLKQAYALGKAAVKAALAGDTEICPIILRQSNKPYRWTIGQTHLRRIANREKKVPRSFITREGFGITKKGKDYLLPLIKGEDYPPFQDGIPWYESLKLKLIKKKLRPFLRNKKRNYSVLN
jgi:6-phosphofructokinase 1